MIVAKILILLAGFCALIKGAGWFVDGSSGLAKRFGVPELIIGLTIVAMGTSAPELAVSVTAALQGSNELALSNVVGSNIFNLLCVLGVCALLQPVRVDKALIRRDFPLTIAATVLVLAASCLPLLINGGSLVGPMEASAGTVTRPLGALLTAGCLLYVACLVRSARRQPREETSAPEAAPLYKLVLMIAVGLALIIIGGEAVVYAAKEIARAAGMTETLIGLTIVAVGTSLPELATSVVAARKGETELALGNALGSNLFNILLILGISSMIRPIAVNLASVFDLLILTAVSLIAFVFSLTSETISRAEGAMMLAAYIAEVIFAVIRQ